VIERDSCGCPVAKCVKQCPKNVKCDGGPEFAVTERDVCGCDRVTCLAHPRALSPSAVGPYQIYNDKKDWAGAQQFCENVGGHLAVIGSPAEEKVLKSIMRPDQSSKSFWIGARCSSQVRSCCMNTKCLDYRGSLNTTKGGYECKDWKIGPSSKYRQTQNFEGLDSNFCRNPSNNPLGLWCYTNKGPRYDYCDVPSCASWFFDDVDYSFTKVLYPTTSTSGAPLNCQFPGAAFRVTGSMEWQQVNATDTLDGIICEFE